MTVSQTTTDSNSDQHSQHKLPDSARSESTAQNKSPKPSKIKLGYDIVMMILIIFDLIALSIDAIMMSTAVLYVGMDLGLGEYLQAYREGTHISIRTAMGVFTIFLVVEIIVRWIIAIKQKRYYRWFFFPFVHWYEVLGCFPQLRALRLLRAFVIGRRLHQLGYKILPNSWLKTIKFYLEVLLEELSDRVILTGIDNFREQLNSDNRKQAANQNTNLPHGIQKEEYIQKTVIQQVIENQRDDLETMINAVVKQVLSTHLQTATNSLSASTPNITTTNRADANTDTLKTATLNKAYSNTASSNTTGHSKKASSPIAQLLAIEVGAAIQDALVNTPELHRYLRMIPIAGALIEEQILQIGQQLGENVVLSLNQRLLNPTILDNLISDLIEGITNTDVKYPALDSIITNIITDTLTAFENQVKIQQWKHHDYLKI